MTAHKRYCTNDNCKQKECYNGRRPNLSPNQPRVSPGKKKSLPVAGGLT